MEKIIVTGGGGFIGSHLIDLLLEKGNKVICIDNFGSGNIKNLEHLRDNKNFELIEHDITKPIEIEGVNKIFHLASRASPIDYQKYPVETALSNSLGTLHMLELAKKNEAKILFASTSESYGDPKVHPQVETYWGNVNPIGVRSCYDESKRFGEALCFAYHRQYGTDIKVVRIFNTYGPRMRPDDGRVIPNFVNQALRNEPITVYGDGKQTRSFCYVSDLIRGLDLMMNSDTTGPTNLGDPNEKTMLELADFIKKFTGSSAEIVFKPLPKDDPTKRRPDITKAKEELGWEPEVSFEGGIKKTIEYFKEISS